MENFRISILKNPKEVKLNPLTLTSLEIKSTQSFFFQCLFHRPTIKVFHIFFIIFLFNNMLLAIKKKEVLSNEQSKLKGERLRRCASRCVRVSRKFHLRFQFVMLLPFYFLLFNLINVFFIFCKVFPTIFFYSCYKST